VAAVSKPEHFTLWYYTVVLCRGLSNTEYFTLLVTECASSMVWMWLAFKGSCAGNMVSSAAKLTDGRTFKN
jgi:hypothetical protein